MVQPVSVIPGSNSQEMIPGLALEYQGRQQGRQVGEGEGGERRAPRRGGGAQGAAI